MFRSFHVRALALLHKMSQADLHAANKTAAARGGGSAAADLDWRLECSFKAHFGLSDMSVGSFEALAHRLASNSSADGTKQWVRSIMNLSTVQMGWGVCGGWGVLYPACSSR